jgi:hypothetical protein
MGRGIERNKIFFKTVTPVKGKHYRLYAGIGDRFIPCEATFTQFKDRLGRPSMEP